MIMKQLTPLPEQVQDVSTQHSILSRDEQQLAHFGKRQQFRVGSLSVLATSKLAHPSNSEILA